MNKIFKPVECLLFFCIWASALHSQNNKWILGEWKGTGITPGSAYSTVFTRVLTIYAERKNHFVGKLVQVRLTEAMLTGFKGEMLEPQG